MGFELIRERNLIAAMSSGKKPARQFVSVKPIRIQMNKAKHPSPRTLPKKFN
jgi:ribosomal protein S4